MLANQFPITLVINAIEYQAFHHQLFLIIETLQGYDTKIIFGPEY